MRGSQDSRRSDVRTTKLSSKACGYGSLIDAIMCVISTQFRLAENQDHFFGQFTGLEHDNSEGQNQGLFWWSPNQTVPV